MPDKFSIVAMTTKFETKIGYNSACIRNIYRRSLRPTRFSG